MEEIRIKNEKVRYKVKIEKNVIFIAFFWEPHNDNNIKFIVAAEKAVVRHIKKNQGLKFSINGGSGSIGNRQISGSLK